MYLQGERHASSPNKPSGAGTMQEDLILPCFASPKSHGLGAYHLFPNIAGQRRR